MIPVQMMWHKKICSRWSTAIKEIRTGFHLFSQLNSCGMIRRILKYIGVILTVLVGLFCTIIIIDGFFIHYHFWIYPPRYDLSSYISICRNSIRLENAIFRHNPYVEYNDDSFRNWLVKVNDKWYDVYGYDSLDSTLVVNEQTDSLVTYKFKSKYYRTY